MPVTSQGQVNLISREGLQNCTSESEVCAGFSRLLWYVCECIGGEKYEATVSTADVVGQPDLVVWRSRRTIEEKLALVIECKTPWGFDLDHHALLAEIYNSHYYHHEHWAPHDDKSYECPRGLTIGRKVFHAVRQLYGYMATNNSRYGILTTFTTTFLFKQDYQGKLFISKGLAADKFDPITAPSEEDDRELVLITDLPNYHVIASGGSASIVSTELDDIPVAIKAVDTCKKPALLDELQQECDAYVALKTLQGVCIPKLVRHAPVVLWEGILDGLVLSFIKGQTLEKMGLDGIATIPLECRQQAVQDLRKIHSLGVLHGDMAERNLIWCEDDRPRIVFVDFGRAVTSCDVEDGRLKYEEYELCGILQIRYRDTI
ncbi:unnamed protein product [Aphanomyces euteiches]